MLLPEGRGIFREMTVSDNLFIQVPRAQRSSAIERTVLAFPDSPPLLRRVAGTLSGGQQQMVAVARCYLANPRLVLMDEISMGLAPMVIESIYRHIRQLTDSGITVLVVEQYIERVLEVASEANVLVRGNLVYSGPSTDLGREEVLRNYLGDRRGTE